MLKRSMPEEQVNVFDDFWNEEILEVEDPTTEGFIIRISSNEQIRSKYESFHAATSVI